MSIHQLCGMFAVVFVGNIVMVLYILEIRDQELKDLKQRCETFRRAAMTDLLTGLHNRRYIKEEWLPRISHSGDNREQALVCLIDVDNFKWFNDAHSYHTGDRVLIRVGRHIRKQSSSRDSIVRWGGDEFVWVITSPNQINISSWETTFNYHDGNGTLVESGFGKNSQGSPWIPHKVEEQVSECKGLTCSDKNEFHVSLSVGCSLLGRSWKNTFARCDDALKRSKRLGKRRVTIL